jgi:hypothetical protein
MAVPSKKAYHSLEQLQRDANAWVYDYNHERIHSGKHRFGQTPRQRLQDSKMLASAKQLSQSAPKDKQLR